MQLHTIPINYNPKTRNDISNPFNKHPHEELLRLANVRLFNDSYKVEQMDNGRIKVVATDDINLKSV